MSAQNFILSLACVSLNEYWVRFLDCIHVYVLLLITGIFPCVCVLTVFIGENTTLVMYDNDQNIV